jgi:drug/metabolite transporter (DMT)-like permease
MSNLSGNKNATVWPSIALLLAVFLWGSSYSAMKVVVAFFGPMATVWARMVVASILFAAIGWKELRRIRLGSDWKWLALLFLCQPCMYFLCEGFAVKLTSSAQAGMISAILPLMVMLGAYSFLGEKSGLNVWLGCLLSLVGVVWLTFESVPTEAAPQPLLGNLLEVAAMCFGAGYMLLVRKLSGHYHPFVLTGMQFMVGSLFFLPGVMASDIVWEAPIWVYLLLIYLGSLVTLGAFGLYNWGISRVPAGRASVFVNLVPVIALSLGVLFMDETMNVAQTMACVVVFSGVLLSQVRPLRPKPGSTVMASSEVS